jgi:membrane protease YdiL (CAAX protease family)
MQVGDANDERPVATVGEAAAILRPALVLWLMFELAWGTYYLLIGYTEPTEASPAAMAVGHLVVTLLAAVVITRFARHDREACRVFVRPRRGMLELCLLVGIVGGILLAMVERGIRGWSSGWPVPEHDLGWPAGVALVTVAVLPAVFEELMFRGVILDRLQRVVGTRLAIAVQAMLFSAMHLDAVYVLPHFAFGCLAGFLRVAAGALWPCMLMHFCWNGWIVLELYDWL